MLTGTSGLNKTILAIDPGPTESGVVLLREGRVLAASVQPNGWVRMTIEERTPDVVAIEQIRSYGMAVGASVFDTCVEVGRFVECAWRAERGPVIVDLIPRQAVKLELCGSPRAKDANIRQALIDLFGGTGAEKKGGPLAGVKSHAWAALGVAVTCARIHGWMAR